MSTKGLSTTNRDTETNKSSSYARGLPNWDSRLRRPKLDQGQNEVSGEARGLVLFRVIRGGIGLTQRLGARHHASTALRDTHPRTRASQEPTGHHQEKITRDGKGLFRGDAQATCGFSFSASKLSPFFHRVSVIAAILRASVSRAIVGFMPSARTG